GAHIHPEDCDRTQAELAQAIQNHAKLRMEYRVVWPDGSVHGVASHAQFVPQGDGGGVFYGVVQDITERQRLETERLQTETQLRKSEARHRAMMENLPWGAAFIVDSDLRYLLAEGEALAVAGLKPEDLVGKTIFEVLPFDVATYYESLYRRALAGEPFEHEHSAHGRVYVSRGTPLRSPDGEVYAVLAVSYDITARKQAEAALLKAEEQYRFQLEQEVHKRTAELEESQRTLQQMLNGSVAAVSILESQRDEQGTIADFICRGGNKAAEKILNCSAEAMLGQPLLHLWPGIKDAFFDRCVAVVETGEPFRAEHPSLQDGCDHWFDVSAVKNGDGVITTFLDMTAQKKAEQNLMRVKDELTQWATDKYLRAEEQLSRTAVMDAFRVALSDALRSLTDPVQIQSEAMRVLGEQLQVSRALYAEIEDDDQTIAIQDNYVNGAPKLVGRMRASNFGKMTEKLRSGQRIIISDVNTDPDMSGPERATFNVLGIVSSMAVPLVKGGRWVASLGVHHLSARVWSDDEIALLEETAERTWAAVERARAEAHLREARNNLSIAIGAAQMGTWHLDLTQDVSFDRSVRHDQIFGYDTLQPEWGQEIAKRHVVEEDHEIFDAAFARALETGELDLEVRIQWPDGSIHWMAYRGRFYFNENGNPTFGRGVNFDISERKQAEAIQIQLIREQAIRAEAEQSNRIKDEFLLMISHELQSPLVAILGWTRLLRANPPTPTVLSKTLETIERNAVLQANLVHDLLDLSRMKAGRLRLKLRPLNLESVFEAAIAAVAHSAAAKGLRLTWQKRASGVVMGDSNRLQHVFSNLLTNAIKFTPEAGTITVDLSMKSETAEAWQHGERGESPLPDGPIPAYAEIAVSDTGIGIAPDFLPYIFDRFRQARESDSAKGLGLGLAIARHLVELHHGSIEAQSAGEGQGATFVVRLPIL
ncbi:MAG TPA: PAS domain-containing protein, partial [Trichocoleus sp.]